mgnify:CR=1 FL=1
MKILIADKLSESAIHALEALGGTITFLPGLAAEELPDYIKDHEILVVRSTKVTAATIETGTSLSLIIRAGAGVNTIDLEAASRRGIYVANCPGENTQAVAELVIGLMIAVDRRIVDATNELRQGTWNKKEYSKAPGLAGRTLGILGLGSIGKAVARAARGLQMDVIAWSRSFSPDMEIELGIGYVDSPLKLAEKADIVSVNIAATSETQHLCDDNFFSRMKDNAMFINTSRGDVVDTEALKQAIRDKRLRVALDVYENEPGSGHAEFPDNDWIQNIVGTPHIGASTSQAAEAIAAAVVRIVQTYIETGQPSNVVNIRQQPCDCKVMLVRHFNKVGVLANVLSEIRNEGINVEDMENTIFSNGAAAVATLKMDDEPSEALLNRLQEKENIIQVSLK